MKSGYIVENEKNTFSQLFSNYSYYQTNSYELRNLVVIVGCYLRKKKFDEFSRIIYIIEVVLLRRIHQTIFSSQHPTRKLREIFTKVRNKIIMILYFSFSGKKLISVNL